MSNRRSRRANVSQETLERARKQAAETVTDEEQEESAAIAAPRIRASVESPSRRSSAQAVRKRKAAEEKLTPEMVAEILANPTKEVTEEELRGHYGYVLADLRSMGLLAGALMIALVILAQVLPR
jgi:hypothetical protein